MPAQDQPDELSPSTPKFDPDVSARFRSALASRLKRARRLRGFTQQQVADAVGCHKRTIANWENAESSTRLPELHQLAVICRVFRLSADYLLRPPDIDRAYLVDDFVVSLMLSSVDPNGEEWDMESWVRVHENSRVEYDPEVVEELDRKIERHRKSLKPRGEGA